MAELVIKSHNRSSRRKRVEKIMLKQEHASMLRRLTDSADF